jgi:hypothetical protein
VRRFALGHEPASDLCATTTAEERLAMVEALTGELWELAGRPLPIYDRAHAPVSRRPWPSSTPDDEP